MVLSLYITLSIKGSSHGESIFTYIPYVVIGVVSVNILTGLGFIIMRLIRSFQACSSEKKGR